MKNKINKVLIYLRTSTEEQNPRNQLKACLSLNQWGDHEVIEDKQSAWKEKDREGFEKIKKLISSRSVKHLIVWDLDRIYRNRKNLISFFQLCKVYNCKVHSFRQQWLESLNEIQPPFNEIMFNLMLEIMGWLAEDESSKKSERVKLAVRKKKGKPTRSYKGNKWGRRGLSKQKTNKITKLETDGLTMREIADKLNISLGSVHKYIGQSSLVETA